MSISETFCSFVDRFKRSGAEYLAPFEMIHRSFRSLAKNHRLAERLDRKADDLFEKSMQLEGYVRRIDAKLSKIEDNLVQNIPRGRKVVGNGIETELWDTKAHFGAISEDDLLGLLGDREKFARYKPAFPMVIAQSKSLMPTELQIGNMLSTLLNSSLIESNHVRRSLTLALLLVGFGQRQAATEIFKQLLLENRQLFAKVLKQESS